MDKVQAKLIEMVTKHASCTSSRQMLKSLLADYLPANRREVNLLIAAYDEGIVERLSANQDATLTAARFVKLLQSNCGMTPDAALWTVGTWCFALKLDSVAIALHARAPESKINGNTQNSTDKGIAQYLEHEHVAGTDFPEGKIKLVSDYVKQNKEIYYAILEKNASENEIIANGFFRTQVDLTLKKGQLLLVRCGPTQIISLEN